MDRRAAWVLGIVFGGLFLVLFGFLFVLYLAVKDDRGGITSGERVGVVEIAGAIMDSKRTVKELTAFRDEEAVKAIVVRIDSPGGSVGPSQEIYEAIKKAREKKHVVVSMGSLAASGGYLIACAGEKIFANPGTLTGSIGVIMQVPNVAGVLKWAGVEMNTITAGKMKDSGSPFREMTEEERKYFEEVLHDVHDQFLRAVMDGRKLAEEDVRPHADGRVFTGRQAKEWKLVDELGGLDAAVAEAGKLAGIEGEPKVEYPRRERKLLRELFGDEDAESLVQGASRALGELGGFGLQYRLLLVDVQ
ncbi:MAG: signal peptide peptidase SppA [Myxococcales bacterium]|nr:signal peptide peptidase SppA [Myxococcales bacterium]